MPTSPSPPVPVTRPIASARTVAQLAVQVLVTGFVIVLPFAILGLLIGVALDFTRQVLQPMIALLRWTGIIQMANVGLLGDLLIELGVYQDLHRVLGEFVAVLALLGIVVTLGVLASFRSGRVAMDYVDAGVAAVPGLGPVYESVRRVGDILLEDGLEEFQSVALVEFPHAGCYSLAFETGPAPESVRAGADGGELVSLFVPFAPNPVMGGFLVHVPHDRVLEVDMSVEEAGRALITSGLAAGEPRAEATPTRQPVDG